jgi:2-desacetyl-2-hydroxyethyl bacteriochlorophyllide A dehydrogenase
MKALVYFGPKDIRITKIDDLKPEEDEVLIKVKATGICGSDVHGYLGLTGRRVPPMVMGHEFAGCISEIGRNVKGIKVGDRVTAQPVNFCGECEFCQKGLTNVCANKKFLGVMDVNGSMAEYVCVPAKLIYKLPDSMSYMQGAMIEPLAVAYRAVKQVQSLENKDVLIVGAGTIGLLVLQILKTKKARKIFISDLSDFRLDVAKKLGADVIINPSKSNAYDLISIETNGLGVDVAIEAVGISPTVLQAMSALKIGGICIWIGNSAKIINVNMQEVVTRELNISGTYIYTHKEFGEVLDLLAEGNIDVEAVISKVISLEEAPEMFNKLAKDAGQLIKVVIDG